MQVSDKQRFLFIGSLLRGFACINSLCFIAVLFFAIIRVNFEQL